MRVRVKLENFKGTNVTYIRPRLFPAQSVLFIKSMLIVCCYYQHGGDDVDQVLTITTKPKKVW